MTMTTATPARRSDLEAGLDAQRTGRIQEAEAIYRRVLLREPDDADAVHLLGMVCQETGRADEALRLLERAVALDPSAPHFHSNLGGLLGRLGRTQDAVRQFREAVRLRPNYPDALHNLALALEKLGKLREAADAHRRAIALRPTYADSHHHYGDVLRKLGRPCDAADEHRRAIGLRPDWVLPYAGLAADCGELGLGAEATGCHRKIVELSPGSPHAGSDYLHLLHYDPSVSRKALLDEAKRWASRHAEPLAGAIAPHDKDRNTDRPLRVAFVSGDFREHPVARLAEPILANLDHDRFQTFCYSDVTRDDEMTTRIKAVAGTWRQTAHLPDDKLAALVREDRIDILVDLAGHMGGHRLTMFARKPAPVQMTHFNYPDTTGMSAMDHRITDHLAEPAGGDDPHDSYSVEKLARLPKRGWCYQPTTDGPEVGPLPMLTRGHATFAALNKPLKHSPPCIAVWAKVLKAVPGSRLMLLGSAEPGQNQPIEAQFAPHGIGPERLKFVTRRPRLQYLAMYNEADIGLDPFPYNGGVTSCDSLWMGVPFVTLEGQSYLARQGLMLLTNVGMTRLVARSPEQYVYLAAKLASEPQRLSALRASLRPRFTASAICDGPGFARDLGEAYRKMWNDWCAMAR